MEHILEPGTTPSIPLKTSELIAYYAGRVPSVQPDKESWRISADTSAWCQTAQTTIILSTETVSFAEGTAISPSSLTGTGSFQCVTPKDKTFPVILDLVMPINRHMTHLITEVALHNAMTSRGEVLLTETVAGFALTGALLFAGTSTVRGKDSRVSTPPIEYDLIAGVPLSVEVNAFASAHALRSYLADTIPLIRRIFRNVGALQIRYEHDSETEQDWLSIEVETVGEVDQILEQYNSYIRQFNRLVPWPARRLIRLNYDIA